MATEDEFLIVLFDFPADFIRVFFIPVIFALLFLHKQVCAEEYYTCIGTLQRAANKERNRDGSVKHAIENPFRLSFGKPHSKSGWTGR